MKTKIAFIINPHSGTEKGELPSLIQQELNSTVFDSEVVFTQFRGHGTLLAKEFVEKKFDWVIAVAAMAQLMK